VSLELGGRSAKVVFADANLGTALGIHVTSRGVALRHEIDRAVGLARKQACGGTARASASASLAVREQLPCGAIDAMTQWCKVMYQSSITKHRINT
jgi:hypothetical protein